MSPRRRGITVNMLCPGWIPVERHANDPREELDASRALIPADRWGLPQDLAGTVVFHSFYYETDT